MSGQRTASVDGRPCSGGQHGPRCCLLRCAPARRARVHHAGSRRHRPHAPTWRTLVDVSARHHRLPGAAPGLPRVLGLAILTPIVMLLLLVPTMTWVRLRLPGLSRTVEFICLLPLTVPAIVLVVGLTPVYAWVYYLLGSSTLWLSLAYVVLVLPYAYRSLDAGLRAIDVRTLSEAARSLGASWFTVMRRIVLPNLRSAVLSASFLSVALVLGEFTIASLFSKKNLQVAMYELGKSDAKISVAVGLISLRLRVRRALRHVLRRQRHRRHLPSRPSPAFPRRPQGARRMTDAHPRHRRPPHRPAPGLRRGRCPRRPHPAHRARRVRRPARAVRVRQDHRAALPRRARGPRLGQRRGRRPRPDPGVRQQARHGDGVPGVQPVPAHDRAAERRVRPRAAWARPAPPAGPAPPRCSTSSASRRTPTSTPTSSPAASSSASPWPGPWPSSRRCCCSTNRCRPSTPRCAPSCATRSAASSSRSARRPCSSPTTRRRPSRSPTGSA